MSIRPLCVFALSLACLCSCESSKTKFTLSVHSQGSEMESPRAIMPDTIGNPPRKVILKRAPEFTHNNIAAFHAFPSDNGNGNGVALKLDFKGTQALEMTTRLHQGEILRSLVNGVPVDYVIIDRPISDGIFTIWEGVPDEVIEEMGKKYPPISGLKSASSNLDMTPSTKTEKKKAFKLFQKSKREGEAESGEAAPSASDAAAIQSPTEAPLPELPAGALEPR